MNEHPRKEWLPMRPAGIRRFALIGEKLARHYLRTTRRAFLVHLDIAHPDRDTAAWPIAQKIMRRNIDEIRRARRYAVIHRHFPEVRRAALARIDRAVAESRCITERALSGLFSAARLDRELLFGTQK